MRDERLTDAAPAPLPVTMRKDAFGGILDCDDASLPVLGWEREHLVGARSLDFIHPDDHDDAVASWMSMLEQAGSEQVSHYRHIHASGAWMDVEVTNRNALESDGDVVCTMVALRWAEDDGREAAADGTSELRAIHAIRSGERLLRRLAEWLPTGVAYVDANGTVSYANSQCRFLLGVEDGSPATDLFATLDGMSPVRATEDMDRILGTDGDALLTVTLDHPTLGTRFLQVDLRGLAAGRDGPAGLVVSVEDVTDRMQARAELERRASTDPLTGCLNRGAFLDELGGMLRNQDRFVLTFVDVDRMKSQNDTLGHAGGDALLIETADHLRSALRTGDLVGRIGGDEFVAICRGVDTMEGALGVTSRIAAAMNWVFEAGALTFPVSASVGATLVDPGTESGHALARADTAMYMAKRTRAPEGILWNDSLLGSSDARVSDDMSIWGISSSTNG
jgi:diguanylate cyclase (GGDEF)-like protein/PAS domain S-box-containing protein